MVIQLRMSMLVAVLCVLMPASDGFAQHHSGHFHSPGFNNSVGFESRYPIGDRSLGGTYSSPAYTYGTFSAPFFGLTRSGYGYRGLNYYGYGGLNYYGYGGLNYTTGYLQPVIVSTPIFSYSPSVFGYGTGIFSPNFPSGTYVTNAFVGVVPFGGYGSYCQTGWPYVTGLNPYSPSAIIAPSLLNLNVNLNLQPLYASTASSAITDPRIIDRLAPPPEPGDLVFPPAPVFQPEVGEHVFPDEPPLPVTQDAVPILNEFDAIPRNEKVSTLAEKIQSLRYQSSGDDAFMKSDYATADVFYATSVKTAPDRRAPYLRMAIVRIALNDFPEAVRYLKTGLAMKSDASRPWITAEELYGSHVSERARLHGGPLWNWLAQAPLSADRLLLAGTFQKVRGFNKTADQMLDLASHEGTEAMLVSEVEQLATSDVGPRSVSTDLNRMIDNASTGRNASITLEPQYAQEQSTEQADGIFLRGGVETLERDETLKTDKNNERQSPVIDPSDPIFTPPETDLDTAPVPFKIPVQE